MAELRKTGESQYEVLVNGQLIGQVWNWHGSWSAQAGYRTYHGHKSRKQAVERVEQIHQLAK
jgi:formylglycine-generating enzyme required for sulfatase activity